MPNDRLYSYDYTYSLQISVQLVHVFMFVKSRILKYLVLKCEGYNVLSNSTINNIVILAKLKF